MARVKEDLGQQDWRPIIAALANPHTRRLFAQIILRDDPESAGGQRSPSKRRHALASLLQAGLVREADGGFIEDPDVFGRALAAACGPARPVGVERFLNGRGEIDRYPSNAAEHRALLEFVAERSLADGEVVSETELNERLAKFSSDTAALRRYMVDDEVLERTRSGSEYARANNG